MNTKRRSPAPGKKTSLGRRVKELERTCRRLEHERDGYYGEWQHAKNQLEEIHSSKMWRLWMLSIAARRAPRRLVAGLGRLITSTLRFIGEATRKAFFGLVASAGTLYAASWTTAARIRARIRPKSSPELKPSKDERNLQLPGRRLRVLIVSPYHVHPPDHGGGVRLFNLVRELSTSVDLYLLIFSTCGEDRRQRKTLEPYCARIDFHRWVPRSTRRPGLNPPNARLFASSRAAGKIRDIVLGHGIDIVQLEYTELAQYCKDVPKGVPIILTEHDIAFRSFARRRKFGFPQRFPEGNAFGTSLSDWHRLCRYEILACRKVDQIHTMSVDDGEFIARFLPDGVDRVRVIPNGVDVSFYRQPDNAPHRRDVLYVGNFQNLPNVDALEFFVADIWPLLRLRRPGIRLRVVGANPSQRIRRHDGHDGISVIGPMDDLRDAYHRHRVMVAPIRAGSGTRLKILEAFAAGIPVVSTSLGAEGIAAENGTHLLIADTPVAFVEATDVLLSDDELHEKISSNAADLVRSAFDWKCVSDRLRATYKEIARPPLSNSRPESVTRENAPKEVSKKQRHQKQPEVSIIIPTFNGGASLGRCLKAVSEQRTAKRHEIICVDSGSEAEDLGIMHRHGARVVTIDQGTFNHGLTRDFGAHLARGDILVFLNQDAIPARADWLDLVVSPLHENGDVLAAVQGGIGEHPDPHAKFFWDSSGDRFNFTRTSTRWNAAFDGIGFSTVNCAIRRDVWSRFPFGWAPIMEDKKWQREIIEAGMHIFHCPEALVYHTHLYNVRSLMKRCLSEGYGWRALGETYSFADMVRDATLTSVWRELLTGVRKRRVRSTAELFFPCLRPFALWWGNHFQSRVLH